MKEYETDVRDNMTLEQEAKTPGTSLTNECLDPGLLGLDWTGLVS